MVAMAAFTSLGTTSTTVQQAAGHVLAVTWVTFHHLIGWLKAGICDLSHRKLFMVSLLCRYDWGICGQREVDSGIGAPNWSGTLSDQH
uniref:Uncharacterized protein n=1 Tax=Anguilla anguilla TaxID=7936 RepID=A0A0E9XCE7_ANGAN